MSQLGLQECRRVRGGAAVVVPLDRVPKSRHKATPRMVEDALLLELRDTISMWPVDTGPLSFFMRLPEGYVSSRRSVSVVLRSMLRKRLVYRSIDWQEGKRRVRWGLEGAGLFEARVLAGQWGGEGHQAYPPSPEAMFEEEAATA